MVARDLKKDHNSKEHLINLMVRKNLKVILVVQHGYRMDYKVEAFVGRVFKLKVK